MLKYLALTFFISSGVLAYILLSRTNKYKKLLSSFNKLKATFNELDKQAKLIVKTDLELNRTQEELDKRLNGLDALQKISRLISTTLDENEIFERLNQPLLTELGFEKYLILMYDSKKPLLCRVDFGFSRKETERILPKIEKDSNLINSLKTKELISSIRTTEDIHEELTKTLNMKHYVMAPMLSQKDILGIIITGNQSEAFTITEGDEELISILADQISQSVENARLFEEVYRSSQMLELKVQARTQQLTSALEEVQKISNMKSEFISAVSHELRTPLTSIKGYAAILMTGKLGELPEKVKERLEKINKHSDNLVKLINDLLDISRIESDRTEMTFTKYDLASIVDNVYDLLTPQLKTKGVNFVTQIAENTPEIFIDPSQVERIFINLVGNAIKFTPKDGTITVSIEYDDKKVTSSVSDTGIGIKEEFVGKLFNEFYRVENDINQNVKGSGLGLALAKKIVEAHNGKMWVTSKENEGTTFSFTLPLDNKAQQG